MAKFAYTDPQGVTLFQRSLNDIRAAKRAEKEPRMLTKSVSEVAWAAVYALAREMVAAGQAPDVDTAVQQLRLGNHPVYATYLAAQTSGAPTPTTPAADVGKVVKAAEAQAFAKKLQVQQEINKRTTALVRAGKASSELEALSAVFKADPQLYEDYRQSSYASGPLPDVQPDAPSVAPDLPAYAMAKRMALELKQNDPWGAHAGQTEVEMITEVYKQHPELYAAYRQEHRARARGRD